MRLLIRTRKVKLSPADQAHIRQQMAKMARYLGRFTKLEIEVNDIRGGQKSGLDKRVGATTGLFGKTIRVEETSDTVRNAVNLLEDSLERALRKRKEKKIDQRRRQQGWLKRLLPPWKR
jgi:ribosomal subunit interface protein